MEKTCTKCGETKAVSEFGKNKASKDGLRPDCKACRREQQRARHQANREKVLERKRAHYQANKEKICEWQRAHYQANKEKVNERYLAYQKKRYAEDPAYAMVSRLRRRLNNALKGQAKPASTMELVGCSSEKLCAWLEMHFAEGMTWDNRDKWHIDHIKPIASFEDPADPDCWHWSNLQPLWAEDNLRKGDSFDGQ